MKQSEKDGSRKPQSGRVSTRMEGTLSQGCEAASTGWAVVMVGGGVPTGSSEHLPQGYNTCGQDTSTPGIFGVGFSAGLLELFLYVNSSIVSSSLKVDIQRS